MTSTVQVQVTSSGKHMVMFTLFASLFPKIGIITHTVVVKLWFCDSPRYG